MDNPQPSSKVVLCAAMNAVQRLNVDGSCQKQGLSYSPIPSNEVFVSDTQ